MLEKHFTLGVILSFAVGTSAVAQTQTVQVSTFNAVASAAPSQFDRFTPRPSTNVRLDFTIWDEMLKEMVYYTGPSLRQRALRPTPVTGTLQVYGHTSPYRLEGNRVLFEELGPEFTAIIGDYITDLVDIANSVNIETLPRGEQLAFWLNLHNALVIREISNNYPVAEPSNITDDTGLKFHDIPRVTINEVSLSLRNIREDIVYRNWSDPLVIYGFFHGDIGSPSIQRKAYSGQNVQRTLKFSADEFANSLRGFMAWGRTARISPHYQDAAPYFFEDFEADVRAHLSSLLKPDVKEQLDKTKSPLKFASYENDIADLTKGEATRGNYSRVFSPLTRTGKPPTVLQRAIIEQQEKVRRIRKRGLFGTVTIEDIQTVDTADFGKPDGPNSINIGPLSDGELDPETDK